MLETERLVIREWRDSDVDCLMTMSRDVGYNCFAPPGHFLLHSEDEARNKLCERISLFSERRLGKFPVFLKETGEFIGTCGLELFDYDARPEVELGYRLCLQYWGRGYATEAAVAALRYGFGDLELRRIMALALSQNVASLKIIEKLGSVYLRDFRHVSGMTFRLYGISRDRYVASGPDPEVNQAGEGGLSQASRAV